MSRTQKRPLKKLGKMIIESMTGEQLATLLDLICHPQVLLSVMGELKRIDADLAKTLEKIMTHEEETPSDTGLPEIASEKETLERWQALWKEWDEAVSEVGDEHGRYTEQDEEWHPPYFDGYGEVLDPLFDLWKKEMVSRSADYSFRAYDPKDNWVYWLIGAQAEGGAKNTEFVEKVKTWLAGLSQNAKVFKKGAKWLALFTKEVPGSDALAKEYPAFFQTAIPRGSSAESILSHSRQNALEKLDAGQCIPLAMRAWTRRLVSMVPDPSEGGGNYEAQALWMNALYELNPDDYRSLLANWQKTHKLKRNLWRDMKARSLPL